MADLYAPQPQFINAEGAGQTQPQQQQQGITGDEEVDRYLQSLPESERDAALQRLTAPPTGEELAKKVQSGYNPTLEEFDAIDSWHKTHEVNIIEGIGAGIEQVMGDLGRAAGAIADHPLDVMSKSPANVVEAFSQGTRNFYGMAAQSADPSSLLFRFKNFLSGTGSKEDRYNQYMEALAFNRHSEELMTGKTTLVMDKDSINAEVVQAASYIADPTLFIPFGTVASAGMRAVGMGEKMMLAGAKASAIKNGLIGGTLKWGVGAPVEFLGGAVRNTIDYGIERGASAIAATTGMAAEDIAKTAKLSGLPLSAASFAGHSIPYVGAIAETRVIAGAGAGLGEAIGAVGETMLRNRQFGRGINSWAREALENTPNLSGHAKGLLKVLDAVDPMFTYTAAVTQGAAQGALIGGTLGYLSGGEEGLGHGLGAGIALGAVGGGAGKVVADVTNGTLYERVAIQRKMVIEGLKTIDPAKATAFEALVKNAEASGDRSYIAHIDGIIAGIDKVAPNSKFFIRSTLEHVNWLKGEGYDITTGRLAEANVKFKELGTDRRVRGRALGFLAQVGDQFAGKPDEFIKHLQSLPQDHALRKAFFRLDGEQKQVMLEAIKNHGDPEFLKANGIEYADTVNNTNFKDWLDRNNEYFDPSNPENSVGELRRQLATATGKKVDELNARIKHIDEVQKQYNAWANKADPKIVAEADAHQRKIWQGRGSRKTAGVIDPAKARIKGKKLSEYYGDINYAEMSTARVNDLFATGDIAGARKLLGTFLKDNTGKDGVLNDRGRMLRNKLATDGYLDKDGNLRPRRLTANDDQPTAGMYAGNEGFVLKRDADGSIEVHLSLDNLSKDGAAHELFHAIFKESVLRPDFIDRLSKDLLGTFDKNGKLIKAGSVNRRELRDFFSRYIDLTNDKLEDFKDESARLNSAIREFEAAGEAKTISPEAIATLHQYVEEFGAYYFQNWLKAQSPDFLFRGGKLEGMRGIMDSAKNGWLDFWERTFQSKDPKFRFGELAEGEIDGGFKTAGGKRIRVSSLDYFNRDFIRATADTNRGNFDINKLSQEGQAQYVTANGLRNTHRVDNTGRAVRLSRREAARANATAGKEIYKILKGINPNRAVDGDGNFIGRLNDAEMDAIVKSGHVNRAWVNKLKMAYEILDGKQSNVAEFGYHGKTEQITDASYPRLFGDDVSFKHRKAILLGVDLKVGQNGTFHALFHTLDKAVIEARGDNLWKDSAIQDLWQGNRGAMEQDFFRYLENASKPDGDQSKRPSAQLWTDGNGSKRRDALHQMLGMAKNEGDAYFNRPIAEIPLGIRHSVTTFNNDGISSFRVSGTERYNYNHENAFKLLSRNWKPSEMKSEKTGVGEIITHATGFKFIKNPDGTVRAFTSGGLKIGTYDNIELAAKAGEKFSNSIYDNARDAVAKDKEFQDKQATKFKPLSREQRLEAIAKGDVFALQEMKDFVGNRTLLRQTRDEHIYQRALESVNNPEQLLKLAEEIAKKNQSVRDDYNAQMRDLTLQEQAYEKGKSDWIDAYNKKVDVLRAKYGLIGSYLEWLDLKGIKQADEYGTYNGEFGKNPEYDAVKERKNLSDYYQSQADNMQRMEADPEHITAVYEYDQWTDFNQTEANRLIAIEEKIADFNRKNYEAMRDPVFAELNSPLFENVSRQEKADMLAGLVKAAAKQQDYSGLLEAMFAGEYDDKIQTGKPFVAVTTHGTGNVELMMSRLFSSDKLGSHYDIPSSRMGSFSAGSQNTSKAYAREPRLRTLNFTERKYDVQSLDSTGGQLYTDYHTAISKALALDYADGKSELNAIIAKHGKPDPYGAWSLAKTNPELSQRYFELVGDAYNLPEHTFFSQQVRSFEKGRGISRWVTPDIKDKMQKINEYYEKNTPDLPAEQMQLRKVIRMDNPYVVVDPRSYDEHFISPHMKRAMAAGHDGIIFKRFADGGERDNVYVVFKDFMADNIKVIDTSFDGEQVPRGKDDAGRVLKGGKELGLRFKPVEWIKKDLMNHPENRQAWDAITGSGAVVQNFDIKELQGKAVLNISPDNAFTGQLMVGDELVMKGQGGVLFAVNNIEQGGIWASSTTGAKRMFEAMKTLREADLAKGGDGTVYISIPKSVSKKVSSSENGARGYMNVINQLAKNNIIPKEVVQNAIREAVKTHKGILDKNGKEMSLSGSGFDVLNKAMDAFFSEDNAKFKGRGSFVEKLVVEITKAKTNDPKKLADAQKTFDSDAPNLLTNKDVLMEAIGKLFDDPLTKDLNVGDVYAVIKVSGEFDMKQVRMHDSYNTTIVHKGGKKPQLLLLDKPKNMTEFIDSVENKDISSDKSSYTPEELKAFYEDVNKRMDEAKPRGLKGSPLNEGHNPNDFYGINSSGQAAGRFKASLKPREEVIKRATEAGYGTTVYYHGTNKDFTEFKSSPRNHSVGASEGRESGNMFYLSSDPLDAEHYKKAWVGDQSKNRVITAFVKLDNPYDVSSNAKAIPFTPEQEVILKKYLDKYSGHPNKEYQMLSLIGQQKRGNTPLFQLFERNERAAMLKEMGYDGIKDGRHISVFDPEQIKSADDFTYDDAGKEIPLSERFDKRKKDIRWKPSESGEEGGRVYTDAQFKNEFIGKVAAKDPDLTEGLRVEATNNDLKLIDENGTVIGRINSWHDAQDMIAKSGESEIIPSYRGMGYGKLLYSEFMERLRAQGKSEFIGQIADEKNRPIKIRESIAGNTKFEVYDTVTKTYKYLNSGDGRLSQSRYESTGRVSNALDQKAWYKPTEAGEGGRVYNQNSKKFKSGFIGKYAEENPDRVKGVNLQFIKRDHNSYRIRLTDNSKKGESADIGHITAVVSGTEATLSTNIGENYRGRKLSNVVYSEMAERLRAMGVEYVDGQIVNPDGVPVHIREQIIGDTREFRTGKKITREEAARKIQQKQAEGSSYDGIDVYNRLDKNARYKPAESEKAPIKWVTQGYGTEGYNMEIIWMKPSRLLNLAKQLPDEYWKEDKGGKQKVADIVKKLRSGSEMDRPYLTLDRRDRGSELYITSHEGRHRAKAILEVYGDMYIPVEMTFNKEELKSINRGDYDFGKPKSQKLAGSVSRQVLEDKPMLNEDKTGRFKPAEGWRDWNSERTVLGSVIKNTVGYAIIMSGNKFRVYNPQKVLVGIYTKEEEAKRRVQRDEPKR